MKITEFINVLRMTKDFHFTEDELFELVSKDDKLLLAMCGAVLQTYSDVEKVKKMLN